MWLTAARADVLAQSDTLRELRGWPADAVDGCEFERPTLFLRGANSDYLSDADFAEARATNFPLATLATVPNAGHWLHAEQPDAVFKLVSDFVLEHE